MGEVQIDIAPARPPSPSMGEGWGEGGSEAMKISDRQPSTVNRQPASGPAHVTGYAELHALSNFSFLRGASHPQELVAQAEVLGYSALALTDECSMAGIVRAHLEAKDKNLKLIVGSEFTTADGLKIVLLAPTQRAYAQICALITLGRRRSQKGMYQLARNDFAAGLEECLALWIPPPAPIPSLGFWLREHFPERCWMAVELHRSGNDRERLAMLQALGRQVELPLAAAGDVHMHVAGRRALQDTVTAIRHGCTLTEAGHRLFPNGERHLRSEASLRGLYPPELLAATCEIAARCGFSPGGLQYRYPRELVPEGLTAIQHLRDLAEAGIRRRWPQGLSAEIRQTIEDELALIEDLKYEHFFLTVYEIVCFARERKILCQGRGSAANSVVCYALGITEVDPSKIKLLFGRFLSKERDEPPDIDVDFEHERREEVIQHVYEKYGRERAAIAATVISYRSRSAVRDVGKALGLSLDTIDRLAKSQTYWDDWQKFQENLVEHGLQLDSEIIQRLCLLVNQLRGFPRHLSQHVGGFVIAEEPISQLVPLENAAMPGRTIIQWDKNDLEALGLLKVDVLALGMLTALKRTFQMLEHTGTGPTRMEDLPQDDVATYDMICRADTVGVFQIESRAQMSMLPRLRPLNYYDLVIEVAIVRPGPIQGGMVHPYLKRRHAPHLVTYPSPALESVLAKTLGVPIFQEQVMQIAIVAAGFTAGEADQLRRSMAAWNRSGTMERFRQKLLDGMLSKGYDRSFAESIYKQIEGFGEYGFPESHSASFALLTYCSSYLKCHHPAAFFAGLINSQPMGFYQPAQLLEAAKRQRVVVLPVEVNRSDWDCTLERVDEQLAIRLGMRLVRSLREEEANRVVAARARGEFISADDLAHRANLPQRAVKLLALGGALRELTQHRHAALWSALGVERLPAMLAGASAFENDLTLPQPTEGEDILADYHQLGVTTGRHPLALLRSKLQKIGISSREDLNRIANGRHVRVCGLVTHLQHPQTANGVIFGSLEDETGINNIIVWPAVFEQFRYVALKATMMVVSGELQSQEGVIHVVADRIEDYSHWIRSLPRNSRDFR
jgi:error-prone DNA polymerase